jgi:hypothetical protein
MLYDENKKNKKQSLCNVVAGDPARLISHIPMIPFRSRSLHCPALNSYAPKCYNCAVTSHIPQRSMRSTMRDSTHFLSLGRPSKISVR